MNITVIPDMHGNKTWKAINNAKSEYTVSLGDWFDSNEFTSDEQIDNFKDYINYVKEDPEHRLTCIGNHDYSYISPLAEDAITTGYQYNASNQIEKLLTNNLEYLNVCIELDHVMFSHAGLTLTWLNENNVNLNDINKYFATDIETAKILNFIVKSKNDDIYGDNSFQGPLWVRPKSLIKDSAYRYQVVGHTPISNEHYARCLEYNDNHVIFTDSFYYDNIITINTEYMDEIDWDKCKLSDLVQYYK